MIRLKKEKLKIPRRGECARRDEKPEAQGIATETTNYNITDDPSLFGVYCEKDIMSNSTAHYIRIP